MLIYSSLQALTAVWRARWVHTCPTKGTESSQHPPEMGDPKGSSALRGSMGSCNKGTGWGPALPAAVDCHGGMHGGGGDEVVFDQVTPRAKGKKKHWSMLSSNFSFLKLALL